MNRLGFVGFVVAAVAGCGGNTGSNHHDLSPSSDLSTSSDGGGGDMTPSGCGAEDGACTVNGINGLCKSNACLPCVDTTDDSLCATAYGNGQICVNGNCQAGCHDSSTCSGEICDPSTNTCRACHQDADCPTAAPFCNITSGSCSATQPPCTSGAACGFQNSGFCCNSVCQIGGQCCPGDATCTGGETCSTSYTCVNVVNCPSPRPATQVYVNPTAPTNMRGVGSLQCPITSLDEALHMVPSPSPGPFTICTEGTFDATNSKLWPRAVPKNYTLDGTYCSPSPAPGVSTVHTILNVPHGNPGVYFQQRGPAAIHGFDILAVSPSPKADAGIYVANTGANNSVTIYDVTINGFAAGIFVNAANATIEHDSHINLNGVGLTVSGGESTVVTIDVSATNFPTFSATVAEFTGNVGYGINVASGVLHILGQTFTGAGGGKTVRSNSNGTGLYCASGCTMTADNFSASTNTGKSFGVGVSLSSEATATFTNSQFNENQTNGVIINAGAARDTTITNISFGTPLAFGHNELSGNKQAGICINFDNTDPTHGTLNAEGNQWQSGGRAEIDCSQPSTASGPAVNISASCSDATDVAGQTEGGAAGVLASVNNCTEQCTSTVAGHCNPI